MDEKPLCTVRDIIALAFSTKNRKEMALFCTENRGVDYKSEYGKNVAWAKHS